MSDTEDEYDYVEDPDNLLHVPVDLAFKTDSLFGISPLEHPKRISTLSKILSNDKHNLDGNETNYDKMVFLFYCYDKINKKTLFFIPIYVNSSKIVMQSTDNDYDFNINESDDKTKSKSEHIVNKSVIYTEKYINVDEKFNNVIPQDVFDDIHKHNIYTTILGNFFCGQFEPTNMVNVRNIARTENKSGKLIDGFFFHPDCGFAYDTNTDSFYIVGDDDDIDIIGQESKKFVYGISLHHYGVVHDDYNNTKKDNPTKTFYDNVFNSLLTNYARETYQIENVNGVYVKNFFTSYEELFSNETSNARYITGDIYPDTVINDLKNVQTPVLAIDLYHKSWYNMYHMSSPKYLGSSLYDYQTTKRYWIDTEYEQKKYDNVVKKKSTALRVVNIGIDGILNKIDYDVGGAVEITKYLIKVEKIAFITEEYFTDRSIFQQISERKERLELDKFGKVNVKNISSNVKLPILTLKKKRREPKKLDKQDKESDIEALPIPSVQEYEDLPDIDIETEESPFESAGYSSNNEQIILGNKYVISFKNKIFSGKSAGEIKEDVTRVYFRIVMEFKNRVGWYIEKSEPIVSEIIETAPITPPDTYITSIVLDLDERLSKLHREEILSQEKHDFNNWNHKITIYVKSTKVESKIITKIVSDTLTKIHEYMSLIWLIHFYNKNGVFKYLSPDDLEDLSRKIVQKTERISETQTILVDSESLKTGKVEEISFKEPRDDISKNTLTSSPSTIIVSTSLSSPSPPVVGPPPPPLPPLFGGPPPPPIPGGGPPPPPSFGLSGFVQKGNEVSKLLTQKTYDAIQNALKIIGLNKKVETKIEPVKKSESIFKKADNSFFVESVPLVWWNIPGNKKGEFVVPTIDISKKKDDYYFPSGSAVALSAFKTNHLDDMIIDIEKTLHMVVMSHPTNDTKLISIGNSISELVSNPIHGLAITRICTKIIINNFKKYFHKLLIMDETELETVNFDSFNFIMTEMLKNSTEESLTVVLKTYVYDHLERFILQIANHKISDIEFVDILFDFFDSLCFNDDIIEKCRTMDYVTFDKKELSPLTILFQYMRLITRIPGFTQKSMFHYSNDGSSGLSSNEHYNFFSTMSYLFDTLEKICRICKINFDSDKNIEIPQDISANPCSFLSKLKNSVKLPQDIFVNLCSFLPTFKDSVKKSISTDTRKEILIVLYDFFHKDQNHKSLKTNVDEIIPILSKRFHKISKFISGGYENFDNTKYGNIKKPTNPLHALDLIFRGTEYFVDKIFFELYLFSQFDRYGSTQFMFGSETTLYESQKSSQMFLYFISRLHGLPDIIHYFSKGIVSYEHLQKLFSIVCLPPKSISSTLFQENDTHYGLVEQLQKVDELRIQLGITNVAPPEYNYIYDRFVYKTNEFMKLGFTNHKLKCWVLFCTEVKPTVYDISKDIMESVEMLNVINQPFVKNILTLLKNIHMVNSKKVIRPDILLQDMLPMVASQTEKKIKESYDMLSYSLLEKIDNEIGFKNSDEYSDNDLKKSETEETTPIDLDIFSEFSVDEIDKNVVELLKIIYSNERETYLTQLITLPKVGKGSKKQYLDEQSIDGKMIEILESGVSIPSRLLNFASNPINSSIHEIETELQLIFNILSPPEVQKLVELKLEEEKRKSLTKESSPETNDEKKIDAKDKKGDDEKLKDTPIMSSNGSIVKLYEKIISYYPVIFNLLPLFFVNGDYYKSIHHEVIVNGTENILLEKLFGKDNEFLKSFDKLSPKFENMINKKDLDEFRKNGFLPNLYLPQDILYWNSFSKIFTNNKFYKLPTSKIFGIDGIALDKKDDLLQFEYIEDFLTPPPDILPQRSNGSIFGTGENFVIDSTKNQNALDFKNHLKKQFPSQSIFFEDQYTGNDMTLMDYYNKLIFTVSKNNAVTLNSDAIISSDIRKNEFIGVQNILTQFGRDAKFNIYAYDICCELENFMRQEHAKTIDKKKLPDGLVNIVNDKKSTVFVLKLSKKNSNIVYGNIGIVDAFISAAVNFLSYLNPSETKEIPKNIKVYDYLIYYGRFFDRIVNVLHFNESNLLVLIMRCITIYQITKNSKKITNQSMYDLIKSVKNSKIEMVKFGFKSCTILSDVLEHRKNGKNWIKGKLLNPQDIKTYEYLCFSKFLLGNEQ